MFSLINKETIQYNYGDVEITFNPSLASIVNKYPDIYDLINFLLKNESDFAKLYNSFMVEYFSATEQNRLDVFLNYQKSLISYIDLLFEKYEISKNMVIKKDPTYKLNINDIEGKIILKTSLRTRFFIFVYLSNVCLNFNDQKIFQNIICDELLSNGIVNKLYSIVESMVMSTNPNKSGKQLWNLLSNTHGYSFGSQTLKLLTSMFYKSLPCLNADENPIAFLISVAKCELSWLLKTSLRYVCVPTQIDILDSTFTKNDILSSEIFYRTIVKNMLNPIIKEYEIYAGVCRSNVYVLIYSISQLLVTKVFNLSIKTMNINNIHALNFYTHKFLQTYDPSKKLLLKILLSAPSVDKVKQVISLPPVLDSYVKKKITSLKIQKYLKQYSIGNIKKIIINNIINLYKMKYYDVNDRKFIDIDWFLFIDEYIDYIYNIIMDKYNEYILIEQTKF